MNKTPKLDLSPKNPSMVRKFIAASAVMLTAFGAVEVSNIDAQEKVNPEIIIETDMSMSSIASEPIVPAGSITNFNTNLSNSTVVVNLAATETASAGFVQLMRKTGDKPGDFSTLNTDSPNQTRSGLAIVNTDSVGEGSLFNQSGAHFVIDVQGSFNNEAVNDVPDTRLFDSRNISKEPIPAGTTIEFQGGKPNSVAIVNLAATDVMQDGYVQVLTKPGVDIGKFANLNASKGQTINKLSILAFDENGKAFLYSQGVMHLVADLVMYMNNGSFIPINELNLPSPRLYDSREYGDMPGNGSILQIKGIPDTTAVVSVVATEATSGGYLQFVEPGGVIGSSANLNYAKGETIGNIAFVTFDSKGIAPLFMSAATHVVLDIQGAFENGVFIPIQKNRVLDTRVYNPNRPKGYTVVSQTGDMPFNPNQQLNISCKRGESQVPFSNATNPNRTLSIAVSGIYPASAPFRQDGSSVVANIEYDPSDPNGFPVTLFQYSDTQGNTTLSVVDIYKNPEDTKQFIGQIILGATEPSNFPSRRSTELLLNVNVECS